MWVFLYGGHHDQAYKWAEAYDVGRHPTRGQLQIVAPVETVRQSTVDPSGTRSNALRQPPLFGQPSEYLLSVGVPKAWFDAVGVEWQNLAREDQRTRDGVQMGTMHRAKGLEFKVVLVLGCDDGVLPNRAAFQGIDDPVEVEEAIERERNLLYAAMTRARDGLVLTWVRNPSRFVAELLATGAPQ